MGGTIVRIWPGRPSDRAAADGTLARAAGLETRPRVPCLPLPGGGGGVAWRSGSFLVGFGSKSNSEGMGGGETRPEASGLVAVSY